MIAVHKLTSIKSAKGLFSLFVPQHSYQCHSVLSAVEDAAKHQFLLSLVKSPFRRNIRVSPQFRVYIAMNHDNTPFILAPVQIVGDVYHIAGFSSNIDYDDILWGGGAKSRC